MSITLRTVENLAPDQSSLTAATKLTKPAKWPVRARGEDGKTLWGECQGSGANPYRVVCETEDFGYKCSCPSRKFPCKHVLAILWMFAQDEKAFGEAAYPDWVAEWRGRKKRTGAPAKKAAAPAGPKNINAATREAEKPEKELSEEEIAKRQKAAEKRAADTRRMILDGLDELEVWIADQLRTGLSGFLSELGDRCRRIAARLVDARAQALAGRIDELPGRILSYSSEERPDAALQELSRLLLAARAFRANPEDPLARMGVATSPTREDLLSDPQLLTLTATWEVIAERTQTQRDNLIRQETWLLAVDAPPETEPRFGLLLDFFPAGTGQRTAAFSAGDQFQAELVFYSAEPGQPRAIIKQRSEASSDLQLWATTSRAQADPLAPFRAASLACPWLHRAPLLLPAGRIGETSSGKAWWRADGNDVCLPLDTKPPEPVLGCNLERTVALWDGTRAHLLAAQTNLGMWYFE